MKLLPSVVLKLLLAAVLSALVTGDSLERLRRGLAAGTSNLDSPTQSTDQLLPPGGGRGREVLDLEETDLDLFRAAFSSKPQALATPSKEERGKRKKKGKGLGKKRDPCLRKYKDFCIHGECKYVKELRAPSCIWEKPVGNMAEWGSWVEWSSRGLLSQVLQLPPGLPWREVPWAEPPSEKSFIYL
ncbi:proheparin-binding EGF-like growth factor isoform X2 [Tursiops truncatus]|uniref:proheparin-binding EGF-like growth factor isoform X2 n=1 Tax=Tursiops truncatus TaxID=9739 RepID=UPI003CCF73F9